MPLMSPADAFQVLNLSRKVTPDEILHAYRIMALRWHPDHYYDLYEKERARVLFSQAADAYRSLVKAGYIFPLPPHTESSSTFYRSPSMLGNESSETLDSFIHLSASSFESHSTTVSPNMNQGTARKQGRRTPVESSATPNPYNRARLFGSDPRSSKKHRPTAWRPFSSFLPQQRLGSLNLTDSDVGRHGHPHISSPNHSVYRFPSTSLLPSSLPNSNPPYAIPLQSIGLGIGGEWTYSLSLSLEELFFGQRCRFNITRSYLSQKTKSIFIEIEVPPGCRPGTRIVCRHVGHESRPGVFQDIAFVVEEAKHNRFVRLFDDLIVELRLSTIRKQGGNLSFAGIDGANLAVRIDYPRDKQLKGRSVIPGAGMPIRQRGRVVGRGNLVVQWEILPHQTKILHFLKRLIGRK